MEMVEMVEGVGTEVVVEGMATVAEAVRGWEVKEAGAKMRMSSPLRRIRRALHSTMHQHLGRRGT